MKIRVRVGQETREYNAGTTQRQIMDDLYDTAGLNPQIYTALCTKKEGQLSALIIGYDLPLGPGLDLFLGDYRSQNLWCRCQSDNFPLSFTPAHIIYKYPELANAVCYSGTVNIFAPENRNKTLWQLGIPPGLDISLSTNLPSAPPLEEEDEKITIYVHYDNNLPSSEEILKTKTVREFILERSGSQSIDEWKKLGIKYHYTEHCQYSENNQWKERTAELTSWNQLDRTFEDIFPGQREIHINLTMAQDRSADEIDEHVINDHHRSSSDNYNVFTGSPGITWSTTTKYVAGGAAAGFAVAIVAEGSIGILVACEEQYTIAGIISPLTQVDVCMPYVSAALGIVVLTALGALIGWAIAPEMPKNAQHYQRDN